MKKALALILALVMVLSLAACGRSKATYNDAGYYEIFSSTDPSGETMTRADYDAADWLIFLQLDEDGTGVLDWDDGDTDALTWSDGSITAGGETYSYALAGGMLTLEVNDGAVYILKKTDAPVAAAGGFSGLIGKGKAAAAGAEGEKAEPAGPAGTYTLVEMQSPDPDDSATREDIEMLAELGLICELTLREDGAGELVLFGESQELTWDENGVTVDGETVGYTLDGDTLTLSQDGMTLVFERSGAADNGEKNEGDVGDLHVKVVGAEPFVDHDDKDAIRFYFEFTNAADDTTTAYSLNYEAEQDGYELVDTYAWTEDDAPEFGNSSLSVEPGVTILCLEEYNYKPDGGEVVFTVSTWGTDDTVVATFDPANLPGRPDVWEPEPIEDPQFYLDYPAEGSTDDYAVKITDAEIVDADSWYDYDTVIRVYFDFTNNGDEATSCWWATNIYAYQDGVQLEVGYPEEEVDSDGMFSTDIEPGETVTCSRCFALRSDTPVEVAFATWRDVIAAGTFYAD